MSDLHAWPPEATAEEQALHNAKEAQRFLGRLAHQLKGDENQIWRARLLDVVGLLDRFADAVKDNQVEVSPVPLPQVPVPMARPEPAPVPSGPRHRVGEQTDPNLRRMRGNSPWWPR